MICIVRELPKEPLKADYMVITVDSIDFFKYEDGYYKLEKIISDKGVKYEIV